MRKLYSFLVLVCMTLLGSSGCYQDMNSPAADYKVTMGGGATENSQFPGIVFGSPNLIQHANQPGILFGLVQMPDGVKQINYFILFSQDRGFELSYADELTDQFLQNVTAKSSNGEIKIMYRVTASSGADTISESITINDRKIDLGSGRLFLENDGDSNSDIRQIAVKLPTTESSLNQTEDIELFALDTLKQLRSQNEEVDDFCRLFRRDR